MSNFSVRFIVNHPEEQIETNFLINIAYIPLDWKSRFYHIFTLGIRKRVNELLVFCSDKIEDYKFNIVWDSPKQSQAANSVRNRSPHSLSASSRKGTYSSWPIQTFVPNDACQVKAINNLCQPLMINVKFNPSWSSVSKRGWCQQATTYFRCLKSRLDKCPLPEVQNQFQQLEHYLQSQININCPGGVNGCTRHSPDARCKIGLIQSNSSSSILYLSYFVVRFVLQILLLLLVLF